MFIRLNVPWLFHFQAWQEDRLPGMPFMYREKGRGSLNIGRAFFQLTKTEGSFFLLELSGIRFQIGELAESWPARGF